MLEVRRSYRTIQKCMFGVFLFLVFGHHNTSVSSSSESSSVSSSLDPRTSAPTCKRMRFEDKLKIHLVGRSEVVQLRLHNHPVSGACRGRRILKKVNLSTTLSFNSHLLSINCGKSNCIPCLVVLDLLQGKGRRPNKKKRF